MLSYIITTNFEREHIKLITAMLLSCRIKKSLKTVDDQTSL